MLNNKCIVVLGMHRSGTSALAGLLSLLGVDFGKSLSLSDELVNPKGFWEHQDIVAIHEDLLEHIGSSWDDVRRLPDGWWLEVRQYRQSLVDIIRRDFSQSSLWGLKDPRLCLLLPLWLDIFRELMVQPLIVMTVRHPLEVAESLQKRDNFIQEKTFLLWLKYLIEMEQESRGIPRYLTTYEQLLSDWRDVAKGVAQSFSLNLTLDDPREALADEFLELSLRHHFFAQDEAGDELADLSCSLYSALLSMPLDSLGQTFESAESRISTYTATVAPWAGKVRSLEKEISRLAHQNYLLTKEVDRVKASGSWKVTRPLRLIANLPRLLREVINRST